MKIREWIIKKLGGYVKDPRQSEYKYKLTAYTQSGESVPLSKINPNGRKSKSNTIQGFNVYRDNELSFYIPLEQNI